MYEHRENRVGVPSGLEEKGRRPAPLKRLRAEQQRAMETRSRIVSAAIREFARFGFEGTSTRTIAKNANVKQTLITYHFEGKEGLWKAALASINEEWQDIIQTRLAGLRGVDEVTKLRLVYADFIRFSAQYPDFHAIMSHVASRDDERLQWLLDEYIAPHFQVMETLIRSAQEAGRFVKGNPRHLQYLFIGAAVRIFMVSAEAERILNRRIYDEAMIEEHIEAVLGLFFREPS